MRHPAETIGRIRERQRVLSIIDAAYYAAAELVREESERDRRKALYALEWVALIIDLREAVAARSVELP